MFGELVRRAQHVRGLQGRTHGSESMRHLITQPARRDPPATHPDITVEPALEFVMNQRHHMAIRQHVSYEVGQTLTIATAKLNLNGGTRGS